MSPPIRDGSGNDIGAIRLGDGTEISEVRTGAGDVVFSASEIPDSVTNHWPADEGSGSTLFDDRGSADGSINGATWVTDSAAVNGHYLDYDGADDKTDLPNGALDYTNQSDFTVTAWVFVDDASVNADILNFGGSSSGGGWSIECHSGNLQYVHHGIERVDSGFAFTNGEWVFVAVRYDAANGEVTFDFGDQMSIASINSMNDVGTNSAVSFGSVTAGGGFWDGGIDEATATDGLLTDQEIADLRSRR